MFTSCLLIVRRKRCHIKKIVIAKFTMNHFQISTCCMKMKTTNREADFLCERKLSVVKRIVE
ncbi:hypothetical protein T11_17142, partial [Trichinella zimbabwensis]